MMKKYLKFAFAFLAISIVVMSCTKDEDDKPDDPIAEVKTTFTFEVGDNYITENDTSVDNRAWVLIYSLNNELLYEQEVKNGNKYEYELAQKGEVNVQLFTASFSESYEYRNGYNFSVYTKVTPDDWKLTNSSYVHKDPLGHATIYLNDIDFYGYRDRELKSKHSRGYYTSSAGNVYVIPLFYNPDAIWLCLQLESGPPIYKSVPNVKPNDVFSVRYSDLETMNSLDVELPPNEYSIIYVEGNDLSSDDNWSACYYKSYEGLTSVKAYYPVGVFDDFWTYYKAKTSEGTSYYVHLGPNIPKKLELLNVDVSVADNQILNFQASTTGTADLFSTAWSYNDNNSSYMNYSVVSKVEPSISYKAPPIPQVIIAIDDDFIDLNKLINRGSVKVKDYSNIRDYKDYIKAFKVDLRNISIRGADIKYKYYYYDKSNVPLLDDKEMIRKMKQELY